jgi:prepilin signal peptidase PulO-like enzyme (type II secretory pathway)
MSYVEMINVSDLLIVFIIITGCTFTFMLLIFFTYILLAIIVDVHTEIRKYGQVSCVK